MTAMTTLDEPSDLLAIRKMILAHQGREYSVATTIVLVRLLLAERRTSDAESCECGCPRADHVEVPGCRLCPCTGYVARPRSGEALEPAVCVDIGGAHANFTIISEGCEQSEGPIRRRRRDLDRSRADGAAALGSQGGHIWVRTEDCKPRSEAAPRCTCVLGRLAWCDVHSHERGPAEADYGGSPARRAKAEAAWAASPASKPRTAEDQPPRIDCPTCDGYDQGGNAWHRFGCTTGPGRERAKPGSSDENGGAKPVGSAPNASPARIWGCPHFPQLWRDCCYMCNPTPGGVWDKTSASSVTPGGSGEGAAATLGDDGDARASGPLPLVGRCAGESTTTSATPTPPADPIWKAAGLDAPPVFDAPPLVDPSARSSSDPRRLDRALDLLARAHALLETDARGLLLPAEIAEFLWPGQFTRKAGEP